ncbi:MAG: hypothetical protein AAF804_11580 [Bacteroidota bacterium]
MHPTIKKLQFKDQGSALVLASPASFAEEIASLAEMTELDQEPREASAYEFALFFCENQAAIVHAATLIPECLAEGGLLWMAYPKKSSKKYQSDIHRDSGWEPLGKLGYEGVRQVAIDADWWALGVGKTGHHKKNHPRARKDPGQEEEKTPPQTQ